jgi:hypothetical protein
MGTNTFEKVLDEPEIDVRIVRINTDKTRKVPGSEDVYHIYFELIVHPPAAWDRMFSEEWEKGKHVQKAAIEGGFLILDSRLKDVTDTTVHDMKRAISAANAAYSLYAWSNQQSRERREDVWKDERQDVERLARSLRFE